MPSVPDLMGLAADGCSHWFDSMFGLSWRECCDVHDVAFLSGGEIWEWWAANLQLMNCVNAVLYGMGYVMFFGVTCLSLGWWTWRKAEGRRGVSAFGVLRDALAKIAFLGRKR